MVLTSIACVCESPSAKMRVLASSTPGTYGSSFMKSEFGVKVTENSEVSWRHSPGTKRQPQRSCGIILQAAPPANLGASRYSRTRNTPSARATPRSSPPSTAIVRINTTFFRRLGITRPDARRGHFLTIEKSGRPAFTRLREWRLVCSASNGAVWGGHSYHVFVAFAKKADRNLIPKSHAGVTRRIGHARAVGIDGASMLAFGRVVD